MSTTDAAPWTLRDTSRDSITIRALNPTLQVVDGITIITLNPEPCLGITWTIVDAIPAQCPAIAQRCGDEPDGDEALIDEA